MIRMRTRHLCGGQCRKSFLTSNRVVLFAMLVCLPLLSGCAGLTLATIGSIAGATATAAQAGEEVYTLGKLDSAETANLEAVARAVHQAGDDLSLRLDPDIHQSRDPGVEYFRFLDERNTAFTVRLTALTKSMVEIRIDVGVFGSEVTAHLFLSRIRAHLPRSRQSDTRPSAALSQGWAADDLGRALLESPGGLASDRPVRLAKLGREESGTIEPQIKDAGIGQVAGGGIGLCFIQPEPGAQVRSRKTSVYANRPQRLVHQLGCFAGHSPSVPAMQ